jgi:septum formation topological specificity factor MinE
MLKKIKNKICEIICKYLKLNLAYVVMNATVTRRTNNGKKI